MEMKDLFRNCVTVITKLMRSVEWKTPHDLTVMQPYSKAVKRLDYLYFPPKITKNTNEFPPNFVHSLDSTHMMLTALNCRRYGVKFVAVYNLFWTNAKEVTLK